MFTSLISSLKQSGTASTYRPLPMSDIPSLDNDTSTQQVDGVVHREVKRRWVRIAFCFRQTQLPNKSIIAPREF